MALEVTILEQLEKEESMFLSLCSPYDRDLLTGHTEMTLQDFERITYLTMALSYETYSLELHKRYMDLTNVLSEQIERENELLSDYPAYYPDEETAEKYQKWIDDSYNLIPADKQPYYCEKLNTKTELR